MKSRAHVSLMLFWYWRHSCIHMPNACPYNAWAKSSFCPQITWHWHHHLLPKHCFPWTQAAAGLPSLVCSFHKMNTGLSLGSTSELNSPMDWPSEPNGETAQHPQQWNPSLRPSRDEYTCMPPFCVCQMKRLPGGHKVTRLGSGFISQPRPLFLCTNSRSRERVTWNMALSDWLLLPQLRCRNLTNFYIFFKSQQFKIGLPFHIFIQSGLMRPCLYCLLHPCRFWLSQHYEDVLQIGINGNIKTLAVCQRSSRQVDLCYTHPRRNMSGIFHISLDRTIFLCCPK